MTNTFREQVWPIIMNSVRPFQTKLMGVDQSSQFRPNFTILEYLEYLEYLELGQFRIFCDVFNRQCLSVICCNKRPILLCIKVSKSNWRWNRKNLIKLKRSVKMLQIVSPPCKVNDDDKLVTVTKYLPPQYPSYQVCCFTSIRQQPHVFYASNYIQCHRDIQINYRDWKKLPQSAIYAHICRMNLCSQLCS